MWVWIDTEWLQLANQLLPAMVPNATKRSFQGAMGTTRGIQWVPDGSPQVFMSPPCPQATPVEHLWE